LIVVLFNWNNHYINIYFRICDEDNMKDKKCIFKCGKNYGQCPEGQCCSKKDYCGTNSQFCSPSQGCQSSFGKCVETRCGPGIGKCSDGQCCSKKGYCGTNSQFCSPSQGCQAKYGKCIETRCGPGIGKCSDGQYCSKKGYCGTTAGFCSLSKGCQRRYGSCEKEKKVVTLVNKKVVTVTKAIQ